MSHPLLVVLDLEGTLFWLSDTLTNRQEDFRLGERYGFKRPGLDAFLASILNDANLAVAVWSSSTAEDTQAALLGLGLDPGALVTIFTQEDQVGRLGVGRNGEKAYVVRPTKSMVLVSAKTGWPIERVVCIDNNQDSHLRQRELLLPVKQYDGYEIQPAIFPALLVTLSRLHQAKKIRGAIGYDWYHNACKELRSPVKKEPATESNNLTLTFH